MILLLLGIAVIFGFYHYFVKPLSHWKDRGVPHGRPVLFLGNNWGLFFKVQSYPEMILSIYNQFPGTRYTGMFQFNIPTLLVKDPELLKRIAVKDFEHFTDHNMLLLEESDPLWGKNLVGLKGQNWRQMRTTLSPSFTSRKIKIMFSMIMECAENFINHFQNVDSDGVSIELKDVFNRFTTDAQATTVCGLKVDSLAERNNAFYLRAKELIDFSGLWTTVKMFGYSIVPKVYVFFQIRLYTKRVRTFFTNVMNTNIQVRLEQGICRPDLIHLLLQARKDFDKPEDNDDPAETGFATGQETHSEILDRKPPRNLTNEDITAQAMLFLFAGIDSLSGLLSFITFELAMHPDIQSRLRKEVKDTLKECGGKLTYDVLLKMKYLDMVISETLRKWPNFSGADRACTKDYLIEPATPDEKPLLLKKGDCLLLPIFGLHRDPKYFPDPERFDPERFSETNKKNIKPFTFLPFGLGPRHCLGARLVLLEAKILIFHILANFEIYPVEKTFLPVKFSKKPVNSVSFEDGFSLGLKRIITEN